MDWFAGIFGYKKNAPKESTVNTIIIQDSGSGVSGTQIYGGVYAEEYLHTLTGMQRAIELNKVRNDYGVAMLLAAVKNPILRATREVHAASEDLEQMKHKALIEHILFKDIDLDDFISDALTMCDFGYALFEESHIPMMEPVVGEDGNVILGSYIGLNQPEWRDPKTIYRWNFDQGTKKLSSVTQQAQGDLGGFNNMDAQFLNVLTYRKEGQNLEGKAMIRPCYGPWMRKNNYLKLNAINIEKSMPVPMAEIPPGRENTPEFHTLINVLSGFTTHEQNYMTYPQGWNVTLSNGTKYDPSKTEVSIDNEDKRMAMAFLANFLLLGSSGAGGSYALSNDLSDFFLSGELYLANIIKKAINKYIEKLIILNFGKQPKYPKFEFTGINDKIGQEFATMMKDLSMSNVVIPDDKLEESIRKRLNLPKISEDGKRTGTVKETTTAPAITPDISPPPSPMPKETPIKTLSERVAAALAIRNGK